MTNLEKIKQDMTNILNNMDAETFYELVEDMNIYAEKGSPTEKLVRPANVFTCDKCMKIHNNECPDDDESEESMCVKYFTEYYQSEYKG